MCVTKSSTTTLITWIIQACLSWMPWNHFRFWKSTREGRGRSARASFSVRQKGESTKSLEAASASNSSRFLKCFSQKLSRTVPSISITLFESFSKPAQAYLILRAGCADKKPLKWLFVFTIGRDCIFNSKYANIQSIPKYVHIIQVVGPFL